MFFLVNYNFWFCSELQQFLQADFFSRYLQKNNILRKMFSGLWVGTFYASCNF